MHKHQVIYASLLFLLALPAGVLAKGSDWLVVSLYPDNGVYDAKALTELVPAVEKLWLLEDSKERKFIRNIDSLATENTIVAQQDSVRFRRLIEQRELTGSGLKTLKSIVDQHPLLQSRIAAEDGKSLNIWVNLKYQYTEAEQQNLLGKIMTNLQSSFKSCSQVDNGPLSGMSLQSVELKPVANHSPLKAFNQLALTSKEYGKDALQYYSAVDLLSILNRSMNPDQEIESSEQIEQLYMIAESVRSRHLHTLASPSFKRFKLMRVIKTGADFPYLTGFSMMHSNNWSANEHNYKALECRPQVQFSKN